MKVAMSTLFPYPSTPAGSGRSRGAASHGKLSASHQRQVQQARLLAVVDQSHAPISKSSNLDPTALATPSSVDCVSRCNHRSAEKLLNQAKVTVAARTMSLITELSMILGLLQLVERVLGRAHVPGGGEEHR
jgi:hypothetical protein